MSTALEMRQRLAPDPDLLELQSDDPYLQVARRALERRHEADRRRREFQARTIVFMLAGAAALGLFVGGVLWLLTRWEVR